ncbi:unnamed protein product [Kuraishia capsulata CBS 1993]|uniref:non-specific serine/threonine protein kinase n=1 Tax=Kuraishia capsulata CBS 1993 TaxID=1382522 RepID=W6MSV2_9ASCO|nr:uncharacterized protein KUCA_T00000817001 [Kuraishia capsulata CBS 1993]CDK24850.1 unnamed protein product [Kuraishia capsulata CBS 1993]
MGLTYKDYRDGGLLQDRYLKIGDISEGSFGIVTLAQDTKSNDTLVAVKYITQDPSDFKFRHNQGAKEDEKEHSKKENSNVQPEVAETAEKSLKPNGAYNMSVVLKEARQEIETLKKLGSHPNITELYDSFDTYLVLEYCVRGDLYDAIRNGYGPGSTRDILDVVGQLINAVEYAHDLGIYHRDIKPENILITEDWTIKLTDWGLATTEKYCTDFDVGSERYMAPELLDHKDIEYYDAEKVDLWSTGICLLNIVFGKNPFASATEKDRVFLHFAANRETLFDIFPSMSYDLFAVLKFVLALDPDNRNLQFMKDELAKVEHVTVDFDIEEYMRKSEEEKEEEEIQEVHETSEKSKSIPSVTVTESYKKFNNRGERKPLAIPTSFRRNGHYNNGETFEGHKRFDFNNKTFKRQDYFTPKSVFKNYIDNADRHREAARSTNWQSFRTKPVNNNNDKRAWRKGKSGYRSRNSYHNSSGTQYFKTPEQKVSMAKSPFGSRTYNSSSSRQGLYVPPNLRSPVLAMNSPLARPVRDDSPELEDIPSDRDDELFVLDDDYSREANGHSNDGGHAQHQSGGLHENHRTMSRWLKKHGRGSRNGNEKPQTLKGEDGHAMYPSLLLPSFMSPVKATSAATPVSASSSQTTATTVSGTLGKPVDVFGSDISSVGTSLTEPSVPMAVPNTKNGVYVPPHHRQTVAGRQPVRKSFNSRADALLSSSSGDKPSSRHRLLVPEAATTITTPLKAQQATVSSSVPAIGTDYWFNHFNDANVDWFELDDDDFDTSNDNDDYDNLETETSASDKKESKTQETVTVFGVGDGLELGSMRHAYPKAYPVA